MFPIPRITESFVDGVMYELGWCRYTDKFPIIEGQKNADYVGPNSVAELKIFEEEPLLKAEHQTKIASFFQSLGETDDVINIEFEKIPESIKNDFENQIARPFQTKIKDASKQMKTSAKISGADGEKIIIAVNCGISYLNADNFEKIFVWKAKRDTKSIDHAACITVEYHQGVYDAYILCTARVHRLNAKFEWSQKESFIELIGSHFENAMSVMMADQMNPEMWGRSLNPVREIRFTRNGVEYIREAPRVRNSRFD